jgi:hypothetical protein
MTHPFYTSRATIRKVAGVHRRALLADLGVPVDCGVHGPVKRRYRLDDARDLPLPADYIVAATGG